MDGVERLKSVTSVFLLEGKKPMDRRAICIVVWWFDSTLPNNCIFHMCIFTEYL